MYEDLIAKLRAGEKCFPGYILSGYFAEPYHLTRDDLKDAADAIEELSLLVKQLQKTHDDRIDFLEFLFNHIQPNEMEHYQTMYHCLDVPTCGESEGE